MRTALFNIRLSKSLTNTVRDSANDSGVSAAMLAPGALFLKRKIWPAIQAGMTRSAGPATPIHFLLLGTGYPPIPPMQPYAVSRVLQFLATTFGKNAPPTTNQNTTRGVLTDSLGTRQVPQKCILKSKKLPQVAPNSAQREPLGSHRSFGGF